MYSMIIRVLLLIVLELFGSGPGSVQGLLTVFEHMAMILAVEKSSHF